MPLSSSTGDRGEWQHRLEKDFAAAIDTSLIAAIVHDPGQTLDGAREILTQLADGQDDDRAERPREKLHSTGEEEAEQDTPEKEVERALAEWKLVDAELQNPANLRLTDEEDEGEGASTAPSTDVPGAGAADKATSIGASEAREGVRLGESTGANKLQVEEIASGERNIAPPSSVHADDPEQMSGFDFLTHAFPSRTPEFLQETLSIEDNDVQQAIDTLMALELAESGALDADDEGAPSGGIRSNMRNDDEHVFYGTGRKKMTKRDRQRRKAQSLQAGALDRSAPSSPGPSKISLTDIRHGAPLRIPTNHRSHQKSDKAQLATVGLDGRYDDAALASRIAREERIAAGLPPEEEAVDDVVRDNDWLFSSSVLDQLGVLLDVPSHRVRSVHALCHMNLRATVHRLIYQQAQLRPTLADLDGELAHDDGTAAITVGSLSALLPSKSRGDIERALRATNGRQDDVLDLLQLHDQVEEAAAGERTDILDPMKADRGPTAAITTPAMTIAAASDAPGNPLLDDGKTKANASPYAVAASQRHRQLLASGPSARDTALERLREGAPSVTFPLNSAYAQGAPGTASSDAANGVPFAATAMTAAQAARMAREYTAIANEYRARRQESLAKAAQAYRSTAYGIGGGSGGANRRQIRGAAAIVYADEARRLDAKGRAFSLQAAQAMVRHRMLVARSDLVQPRGSTPGNGGGMPSMTVSRTSSGRSAAAAAERDVDTSGRPGDIVDLHGVTVHEALTIARQSLDEWWPRALRSQGVGGGRTPSSTPPLHIITGVGRHSRGHVALIRPAVLAMLEREQWHTREPQLGHIVVVGQR